MQQGPSSLLKVRDGRISGFWPCTSSNLTSGQYLPGAGPPASKGRSDDLEPAQLRAQAARVHALKEKRGRQQAGRARTLAVRHKRPAHKVSLGGQRPSCSSPCNGRLRGMSAHKESGIALQILSAR